jgi:ribosomal protein S4E
MPMGGWQSALPWATRPVPRPPPVMYALLDLLEREGLTKKEARRVVRAGKVVIDGAVVKDPDTMVVEGTAVELFE